MAYLKKPKAWPASPARSPARPARGLIGRAAGRRFFLGPARPDPLTSQRAHRPGPSWAAGLLFTARPARWRPLTSIQSIRQLNIILSCLVEIGGTTSHAFDINKTKINYYRVSNTTKFFVINNIYRTTIFSKNLNG